MSWEGSGGKYSSGVEDRGGFSSLYKEKRKVAPSATNYKCQKCLQVLYNKGLHVVSLS
jgi:hypothetical protein